VEAAPKVKRSWEEYQRTKGEYFAAKKKAFFELKERQGGERKFLFGSQREERSVIFRVSWRGKGSELNQRRSVMAAKQQNEKLDLFDRHRKEQEKLRERFPRQFLSFKNWLSLDDDSELSALYRYPDQLVLSGTEDNVNSTPANGFDLRDYSPISGNRRGAVIYCKSGKNIAEFIDYGRKIVVTEKFDESSILAALQLASQKWGSVQINGSEEYRQLCVRLAVERGFKIANPELKPEIEAAHEKREIAEPANRHERKSTGWGR